MELPTFAPYPRSWLHGMIGDRRTAALVSADGTIDWMCAPRFDGPPVFGALLDVGRGGFWKLGPQPSLLGRQRWVSGTVLSTRWRERDFELELVDAMGAPDDPGQPTTVVRRLRCLRGSAPCLMHLRVAPGLDGGHRGPRAEAWCSRPGWLARDASPRRFALRGGQEVWAAVRFGAGAPWSPERAREAFERCGAYWTRWARRLRCAGPRRERLIHSATLIHLLTHAPTGAMVAAPSSSLPERIGGDWNADYRFCWIRDTAIAFTALARLGELEPARRWISWVRRVGEEHGWPPQPLYRVDGSPETRRRELKATGFRDSRPVVDGNDACRQEQHGALGFLAELLWDYRRLGGEWDEDCAAVAERIGTCILDRWARRDNGIWELPRRRHYVSSKMLCWLALERCAALAGRPEWARAAETIRRETLARGFDPRAGAFRQRYGADNADAATLLVSLIEMLPPRDPRVLSNIEAVIEYLVLDRTVYRFHPSQTPGLGDSPLGQFEGAFIPATCWLASALALAGRPEAAEEILERVERSAGPSGLFAEAADPVDPGPLGNYPLAFSHAEYILGVLRWREALERRRARR